MVMLFLSSYTSLKAWMGESCKSHKGKTALDIPQTQSATDCPLIEKICKTSYGLRKPMMVNRNPSRLYQQGYVKQIIRLSTHVIIQANLQLA